MSKNGVFGFLFVLVSFLTVGITLGLLPFTNYSKL